MNRFFTQPVQFVLLFIATTALSLPSTAAAVEPAEISPSVMAFITKTCVDCHGPEEQNADLRFDEMPVEIGDEAIAQRWQDILDVLNLSQMPPEDAEQPAKEELSDVLETLTANLADARGRLTDSGGRVVLRRLNRREYRETIAALFDVPVDVTLLPEDDTVDRFDTLGQAQSFSSLHLQRYLQLGRGVVEQALSSEQYRKRREHSQTEEPEKRAQREISKNIPGLNERIQKHQEPKHQAAKFATETEVALSQEFLARRELETGALIPFRGLNPSAEYRIGGTPATGTYRVQVRCGVVAGKPDPLRNSYLKVTRGEFRSRVPDAVNYYQVSGTVAEPQVIEFTIDVDNIRSNRMSFERRHREGPMLEIFGDAKDYHFRYRDVAHLWNDRQPDLWIDWIKCEGPLASPATPLSRETLLGERKIEDCTDNDVRGIIEQFAFEAFRHQSPTPEFVGRLMDIYHSTRAHGESVEAGLVEALAVVLASPSFLFLDESESPTSDKRALTDRELAIRLAYFLWSAPPDEELYRVAEQGTLHEPKMLTKQVDRMIQSPRSKLFVETFVTQWLELERLDGIAADATLSEAYDDAVKRNSRSEVFAFFNKLLQENLPTTALIDSDFVVVNNVMADYYNLPPVDGDRFQTVNLPSESVRGGLLGQSAVLTLTGNGQRTSPVERGVFVLRKLLNRPPPPAPANVPMLDEESVGEVSIRETLATHMNKAQCHSCHRRIDPLGFALENFDPVGRWRTEVPALKGDHTFAIETAGVMPDGKREFKDFRQMKQHIVADRDAMLTGLTQALMTYGLGRSIGFSDQDRVERIVNETATEGYGLRTLVHKIVVSEAFLSK